VKDLDLGELWANYAMSYVHANLGDMNKNDFTQWPSNYLLKESTLDEIQPELAVGAHKMPHNDARKFF
jgi:hypothetical protein